MKYEETWHIYDMDLWDEDYFNMEVLALVRAEPNGAECFENPEIS